ncbi:MAG: OmpH family outer membrane protein [Candidatus Hydrogenedens sp.]|jgi:Skp family chaperone for outer membrane proteins|nr:OmpH family outer membrane protein [Candidatus Hydrogenedens sp.]
MILGSVRRAGFFSVAMALMLVASGVFVSVASAQAGGDGGYKIGVVDMSTLVNESNKRKAKYDELQQEVDRLQVEIDAMSKRIEKAKDDFEAQRATMDDDERFDKKTQIEADFAQYRNELDRRQRLIDTQEERVLKEVVDDIERVITKVAEDEGYHLILNASKGARPTVLYHSTTIDLTSRVLQIINQK